MDKQKIIEAANSFKNEPIADLKKNLVENSSGSNYKALIQYNAMLDNITIGAHTNTTINYAGVDWKMRLITAEELIEIRKSVMTIAKKDELFDKWYLDYLEMIKVLACALTPNPFKKEGKTVFSENDLKLINYDILENLYRQYIHFNAMATQKPNEMSEEQIQDFLDIVKKNGVQPRDLDRMQLLILLNYHINLSQTLQKMVDGASSN